MNKTNKKGFTLVELLVVIAILAILATVSVVGYTAFIERATVSNDENVAAQLNQFLTAMKADSTGDFYGKEVTPDNVWKVVDTMLKENGSLTELKPQSLDYGYHYFFDITDQKFIVLKDSVSGVKVTGMKMLLAHAEDGKKPGFFTYKVDGADHDIFLIDTTGSYLATVIRGFYTLDGIENGFVGFTDALESLESDYAHLGYKDYADQTIFVTKDGNKTTDSRAEKTKASVHEDVNSIKSSGADFSKVDSINVPSSVQAIDNKVLNEIKDSATITTEKTAQELAETLPKDNNGANKEITVKITDGDTTVTITIKIESNKNSVVDGDNNKYEGSFENPMASFQIEPTGADGKVKKKDDGTFNISWDSDITLNVVNAIGEKADVDVVTSQDVKWHIVSVNGSTENATAFVKIGTDGKLTFLKEFSTIVVMATSVKNNKVTTNITLNLAKITAGSIKIGGKTVSAGGSVNVTLVKSTDTFEYPIEIDGSLTKQNSDGITFDESINWTYDGTGIDGTSGSDPVKLTGKGSGTLTVKIGNHLAFTVKLTIEDSSNFSLQPKNMNNFTHLGSKNNVLLSDLFTINGSIPAGAELVVYSGGNYDGDTYMTPKRAKLQKTASNVVGVSVDNNTTVLNEITTDDDLAKISLKFSGSDLDNQIRIAVMHNGVRISEDIKVYIVDAYNIRDYSQIRTWKTYTSSTGWTDTSETGQTPTKLEYNNNKDKVYDTSYERSWNDKTYTITKTEKRKHYGLTSLADYPYTVQTNITKYTYTIGSNDLARTTGQLAGSIVFVNNVTMNVGYCVGYEFTCGTQLGDPLSMPSGTTIYGNCFTFDISNGARTGWGIISLNSAHMQDLRVVGKYYTTLQLQGDKEWGSNAVWTSGTSTITNCYIANCRAPISVGSENGDPSAYKLTIKDSVIYGGNYANIEVRNGTVEFDGDVITVNQPNTNGGDSTDTTKKTGLGIVVWLEAKEGTKVTGLEHLVQYNFIPSTFNDLPDITLKKSSASVTIKTQDAFDDAFTSSDIYKFGSGTTYINAGIIGEDVGDGATKIAETINMTFPTGDRTGVTLSDNIPYSYTTLHATYLLLFKANIHLYTMKNTTETQTIFTDSNGAELKYSPWAQGSYNEYGFNSQGKILH